MAVLSLCSQADCHKFLAPKVFSAGSARLKRIGRLDVGLLKLCSVPDLMDGRFTALFAGPATAATVLEHGNKTKYHLREKGKGYNKGKRNCVISLGQWDVVGSEQNTFQGNDMSAYAQQMSSEEFSRRLEHVETLPFHRFLEISITRTEPGIGELVLHPSGKTINAGGVVHGGIIYSLLDAAGYLAMMPVLRDHQNGVTHDMHASVLNAAPVDRPLVFKGFLRKIGKRLAFCDSEAWSGDSLVATGRITKSIIDIN